MERDERLIRAVQSATRRLTASGRYDELMRDVLTMAVEAVGASGGTIYLHDPASRRLRFQHVVPAEIKSRLPMLDIADDFGVAGAAFGGRQTVCRDFPEKPECEWNAFERATGVPVRSIVATPLTMEGEEPIGIVQLLNKEGGVFDGTDCAVLDTLAAVATMAYHNARLTEESQRAGTLLGMGKVSHDIGNLAASLHATVSVGEYALGELKEHLRDEADPHALAMIDMLSPTFIDLDRSVDRIVGYSRLISDMSAGRTLRPNLVTAPIGPTVKQSAAYLESDGRARGVLLQYQIHEGPPRAHDELYVFRIVQNLVGNAIKAVRETTDDAASESPEGVNGTVTVTYRYEADDHLIEVRDTGPGMAREVADRILSGNARSEWGKTGGSGWGTKIVLELTRSHDGEVEIETAPGEGALFRVRLPHR